MNQLPLVSILIPTYNQPEFFRQALESALNQDYRNIEIIVSDDSTDNRVEKVASKYKKRIKFLKHKSNEHSTGDRIVSNIEHLLEHANGEFVNILFHDDLIYPNKISRMVNYFQIDKDDRVAIISSVRNFIDKNGTVLKTIDTLAETKLYPNNNDLLFGGEEVGRLILRSCGNFVGELSTVLMRRKDFFKPSIKKFSTGYFCGVRDRSMWDVSTYLETLKDGRLLIFLREPLSAFRFSGGNQNTNNPVMRMNLVIDWLAIATACYLKNFYLHNWQDFEFACECWSSIALPLYKFFYDKSNQASSIEAEVIDQFIRAMKSVEQKNFDITLDIGKQWIHKYSSDTYGGLI